MATLSPNGTPGNLIQIRPNEELIRRRVAEERARLERLAGIERRQAAPFRRPVVVRPASRLPAVPKRNQ